MSANASHSQPDISRLTNVRRHLHSNPELSFNEFQTALYIQQVLTGLNIHWKPCAATGTVAQIGTGQPCVAIRADIDALPIPEETGLAFTSTNLGVMHACGHDMHTAMALEAARLLKLAESELRGTVLVIFQPGEEKTPGGASLMIADGAFAEAQPAFIFGQHVDPSASVGTASFVDGPMMAAADEIFVSISGSGAHAAQPQLGRDPIVAAAGLVQHLQTLVTRRRDPLLAGVLSITSIHGGTATNIIPEQVALQGTLRSFDQEWREFAWAWLEGNIPAFCALHGCSAVVNISKGYPPLVNHPDAVRIARSAASSLPATVADFTPKMWAEDFSYYGAVAPSCFWMLGVRPSDVGHIPGLHHPRFNPDESAMVLGTQLLVHTATRALLELSNLS